MVGCYFVHKQNIQKCTYSFYTYKGFDGENFMEKTPPGDFKVTTLENPLLSKQVVTSKGILVPYTNLQLNPYPNT